MVVIPIWQQQPEDFFEEAVIDFDGSLAPTDGECKEGIGLSYKGEWGYHPRNVKKSKHRNVETHKSGMGIASGFDFLTFRRFDVSLCRRGGFKKVLLRGDTDFSQTAYLDGWDGQGVRFLFGIDARPNLVEIAENLPKSAWKSLIRKAPYEVKTQRRQRPENVKERIVIEKESSNIKLQSEQTAEFAYRPTACKKTYRVVVLRKNLSVEKGEKVLFDDLKYFFYITNDIVSDGDTLVATANGRCNQENLIEQLKNGVHALRMPVGDLVSNGAYMVMASLAWTLKAWFALLLPQKGRWKDKHRREKDSVLSMEFKRFVNVFVRMPALVMRTGRRLVFQLLSWNPWQDVFLRGVDALRTPLRM